MHAMINFTDLDCGDEGVVMVRVEGKIVGLALSLMKNGDIEVFFGEEQLEQLIEALQKARVAVG
jgi:hypothetical protein